jgi:hypothetical protein
MAGILPKWLHKTYFVVRREMVLMMSDPIVFEDWETVLKAEVTPDRQRRYREAIVKLRRTTVPTPAGRDAYGAGINPVPSSGEPSKQVSRMDGYRVFGMNDVPPPASKSSHTAAVNSSAGSILPPERRLIVD